MGRILRPEGCVIIRDDADTLVKVKSIVNGLEWGSIIVDHEDGPLQREKLTFAVKKYWTALGVLFLFFTFFSMYCFVFLTYIFFLEGRDICKHFLWNASSIL